jgi:hypothetical protein
MVSAGSCAGTAVEVQWLRGRGALQAMGFCERSPEAEGVSSRVALWPRLLEGRAAPLLETRMLPMESLLGA